MIFLCLLNLNAVKEIHNEFTFPFTFFALANDTQNI